MSDKVLVVDDKQMMRDSVCTTLQRAGYQVIAANNGKTAMGLVGRHRPAAVITDLKMPEMDGLELLAKLRQADDQLPIVLMTAYGTIDSAVEAMKNGAFDFIQKPFEGQQLVLTMKRAVEHRRLVSENAALRSDRAADDQPMLVGRSPVMRQLIAQIQKIAASHGTVLICGESGTGKEVVARTIHAHSPRDQRVMLCLNCAALSGALLESELFGHEKGAFTGADQLRKGRFELADNGTLLLDEISEIDPALQAKLLRVLQEQQFERVGSSMTMQVDVRVIATTNRDLADSVAQGSFRQDLYYRLNVLPLHIPPLRERVEDVPLLADHFLQQVANREGRETKRFDDAAMQLLTSYTWPGNVRELQNICERASVLTRGEVIKGDLVQPWLGAAQRIVHMAPSGAHGGMPGAMNGGMHATHARPQGSGVRGAGSAPLSFHPPVGHASAVNGDVAWSSEPGGMGGGVAVAEEPRTLEEVEREQILRVLDRYHGNRRRTAEALGIGLRTLGLKLKKWKEMELIDESV